MVLYNLRNDFDEDFVRLEKEEKKYQKKRLCELIDFFGEITVDIENGTCLPKFMMSVLTKDFTGDI
ncbi:MAG: hypothetical protein IKW39_01130 [Alphaproteobacteria bacterium]|nr:hypothetical protein [Alphaproteobacteria bacterium]